MNELKNLLKIDFPIVQAPMLGVTTPEMVAAASNAGALGSLPVGGLSPERSRELIKATKALTDRPFAVNLFAHSPAPAVNMGEINAMQDLLAEICKEYNVPFQRQDPDTFKFYYCQDQLEVLIEERIPIVSFTFGQLNADTVSALKKNNALLIGTATSVAEAKSLMDAGIDIIAVQGLEAGGHRGSFLEDQPLPQIGLFSLLPQVADEVHLPLLAAGGIYDRRTMKAAFTLGASGVQIGSLFITANESLSSDAYKNAVLSSTDTSSVLANTFSGRWARGIQNGFIKRMHEKNIAIPYYTFQNQLLSLIRAHAQKNNITDLIALWAGQSAGKSVRGSTKEIIEKLIAQLPDSF